MKLSNTVRVHRIHSRRASCWSLLIALTMWSAICANHATANEIVVLRSGNAAIGLPDPFISMKVGVAGTPLSPIPFSAADFDDACTGSSAVVLQPHPAWPAQLTSDPLAQWIGVDALRSPASALYCYNFDIETCCIDHATLSFSWIIDDHLGDYPLGSGPNPNGVYLNGVAVSPGIFGGWAGYGGVPPVVADVGGLLHCGSNRLEVYNRDVWYGASGVIFSARIEVDECAIPTERTSWGEIKSIYR
jgi:hypothetical protein